MSLHDNFILVAAFLTFVVGQIWMAREFVRGLRTKANDSIQGYFCPQMAQIYADGNLPTDRLSSAPICVHLRTIALVFPTPDPRPPTPGSSQSGPKLRATNRSGHLIP